MRRSKYSAVNILSGPAERCPADSAGENERYEPRSGFRNGRDTLYQLSLTLDVPVQYFFDRTSGYSVDRPLVFLKLLERDAERVGNHFLGQARFLPPQEHARCDVAINRVGKTVRHNQRRLDRFVPWCAQLRRWVQLGSKGLTVRFSCTTLGEQNR
jgi:hypothetical protein